MDDNERLERVLIFFLDPGGKKVFDFRESRTSPTTSLL